MARLFISFLAIAVIGAFFVIERHFIFNRQVHIGAVRSDGSMHTRIEEGDGERAELFIAKTGKCSAIKTAADVCADFESGWFGFKQRQSV